MARNVSLLLGTRRDLGFFLVFGFSPAVPRSVADLSPSASRGRSQVRTGFPLPREATAVNRRPNVGEGRRDVSVSFCVFFLLLLLLLHLQLLFWPPWRRNGRSASSTSRDRERTRARLRHWPCAVAATD